MKTPLFLDILIECDNKNVSVFFFLSAVARPFAKGLNYCRLYRFTCLLPHAVVPIACYSPKMDFEQFAFNIQVEFDGPEGER